MFSGIGALPEPATGSHVVRQVKVVLGYVTVNKGIQESVCRIFILPPVFFLFQTLACENSSGNSPAEQGDTSVNSEQVRPSRPLQREGHESTTSLANYVQFPGVEHWPHGRVNQTTRVARAKRVPKDSGCDIHRGRTTQAANRA